MFGNLSVVGGRSHPQLTANICAFLGIAQTPRKIETFENDNIFVQLEKSVRSQDVFIIQPLAMPVNDAIMELLILLDTCKRASAGRITAVIPYFAYGRSDKKDQPRIPITARLLADIIGVAGANRVLAIDLHAQQIQGFFSIPMDEISALSLLVRYFKEKSEGQHVETGPFDLSRTVAVSPDIGAAKRARDFAEMLGIRQQFAIIDKRRDKETRIVAALNIIGDVAGKTAILIDEEISTGGSVAEATRMLRDRGAAEVYVAATHAVFCGDAAKKFDDLAAELEDPAANPGGCTIKEIVVTDTLPLKDSQKPAKIPVATVEAAEFLANVIRCIHDGSSLGEFLGDEHARPH